MMHYIMKMKKRRRCCCRPLACNNYPTPTRAARAARARPDGLNPLTLIEFFACSSFSLSGKWQLQESSQFSNFSRSFFVPKKKKKKKVLTFRAGATTRAAQSSSRPTRLKNESNNFCIFNSQGNSMLLGFVHINRQPISSSYKIEEKPTSPQALYGLMPAV